MLKLKHLVENFDLAKEALSQWQHDPETLDKALSWFRISSNAVYPFFCKGNLCFLRLAPTEEKMERNIRGELEFLKYLQEKDFPSLRPIPSKTGELLLTLSTVWGDYYACAFEKVPGKQIEDIELTETVLYEYGRTLGKLHVLSADFMPITKKWSHKDALDWAESVLTAYSAPEKMCAELTKVRELLADLPANPGQYGLVHYDFESDNVFFDPTTESCAVIDFDDGMYHWYALDIEQALDSLSELLPEENFPAAKEKFLQGYASARPLPEQLEEQLPLMRRFVDLFGYARLLQCVSEKPEQVPQWMEKLEKKLRYVLTMREAKVK